MFDVRPSKTEACRSCGDHAQGNKRAGEDETKRPWIEQDISRMVRRAEAMKAPRSVFSKVEAGDVVAVLLGWLKICPAVTVKPPARTGRRPPKTNPPFPR